MEKIWTTYSPAFGDLIKTIAKEKEIRIWSCFANKEIEHIIWEAFAIGFASVNPVGSKVTQGEFLDAVTSYTPPSKEIEFNSKILGNTPVLKNGKIKIGCQEFSFESIDTFEKEYQKGMEKGFAPSLQDCWAESSEELKTYIRSICEKYGIENLLTLEVNPNSPLIMVQNGVLVGGYGSYGVGQKKDYKLTPGEFIDRILDAAKVTKKFEIKIKNSSNHCNFNVSKEMIDAKDWGTINHEEMAAFLKEYSEKREK